MYALTLVIVYDVAEMVASAVVGLADRHGVVSEVDIAVVAKVYWACQRSASNDMVMDSYFGILSSSDERGDANEDVS